MDEQPGDDSGGGDSSAGDNGKVAAESIRIMEVLGTIATLNGRVEAYVGTGLTFVSR